MTRGSMNDIAQEMDTGASQADSTLDSTSTQGARQIYERESRIVINYAHLEDDYKDVSEREVHAALSGFGGKRVSVLPLLRSTAN